MIAPEDSAATPGGRFNRGLAPMSRTMSMLSITSDDNGVQGLSGQKSSDPQSTQAWQRLDIPPLRSAHRESKYPNTPLSMVWVDRGDGTYAIFVGLLIQPTLLKI